MVEDSMMTAQSRLEPAVEVNNQNTRDEIIQLRQKIKQLTRGLVAAVIAFGSIMAIEIILSVKNAQNQAARTNSLLQQQNELAKQVKFLQADQESLQPLVRYANQADDFNQQAQELGKQVSVLVQRQNQLVEQFQSIQSSQKNPQQLQSLASQISASNQRIDRLNQQVNALRQNTPEGVDSRLQKIETQLQKLDEVNANSVRRRQEFIRQDSSK